jgi:NAD+ diphosphatase
MNDAVVDPVLMARLAALQGVPDLGFAATGLDRAGQFRESQERQAAMRADPAARVLVVCDTVPVLRVGAEGLDPLFDLASLPGLGPLLETAFLGLDGAAPRFGAAIAPDALPALKARADLKCIDMRSIAVQGLFTPLTVNAIGTAKALLDWHARHRFCARCGGPSQPASSGWKRVCHACGAEHFPRTDPVVIMLAIRGDRCLMGRAPRFPETMYSCLAGFMEPGETIADAVRREIQEEAGVAIAGVRLLFDQPWPFPSSLMLGCIAEATSEAISLDDELADARWFSRDEVRLILDGRHPDGVTCPPRMAIANHLMRVFAEGNSA